MVVFRYAETHGVVSALDPLEDLLGWLEFLTADDYLIHILRTRHALPESEGRSRAKRIIPHVRQALAYVGQSLKGPDEVAFLPAYYAILNLLKVYTLLGPRHADLPKHRWHGVSYDVHAKDSHSVLTEAVTLHPEGAIPLFYETITGHKIKTKRLITMNEVYPYISDMGFEYHTATGEPNRLADVRIEHEVSGGKIIAKLTLSDASRQPHSANELKVLIGAKKSKLHPLTYVVNSVNLGGQTPEQALRKQVRTYLLYPTMTGDVETPLCRSQLLLPEELPIALLFFHMSSVVRYKPEFLDRVRGSRHWPILKVARRHVLMKFMLLFWSFVHQRTTLLNAPTPMVIAAIRDLPRL